MSSAESTYVVVLEKKGRGRGLTLVRPWTVRTFKLFGQTLEYYDGERLKGTIEMNGSVSAKLKPVEAENKEFPFILDTGSEKLFLNASSDEIREKAIKIFNLAANSKTWSTQIVDADAQHQKAASASVVALMKSNVEMERLKEEEARLEQERQQQVAAAAAKVLEEEMANIKLREAKEAEERQREEQERQVMELLKGLGGKAQFRAALKAGKMDVAKTAAATMLQGAWRSKVARRKMLLKKAEKEKLRAEGYAKKIQCRYRARLARKRIEKIKAEKLLIKQEMAALKFQCAWRIFLARRLYIRKQELKLQYEFSKSVHKQRGIIRIQNIVRAFIACKRVARIAASYPQLTLIAITATRGLNLAADVSSAEPFAVVSGVAVPVSNSAGSVGKRGSSSSAAATTTASSGSLSSPSAAAAAADTITEGGATAVGGGGSGKGSGSSSPGSPTASAAATTANTAAGGVTGAGSTAAGAAVASPSSPTNGSSKNNNNSSSSSMSSKHLGGEGAISNWTSDVAKSATVTSFFRTSTVPSTSASASGPGTVQVAMAASASRMQHIVVTLVDHASGNKDDFLGQVCLRLADYPQLTSKPSLELNLPLEKMHFPIPGATARKAVKGTISLTLSVPDTKYTMCGNIWKVSESLLSAAWKRRWFVLLNGQIQYYNNESTLEHPKNVIICKDVTSIVQETYKGRSGLKISFHSDSGDNFWMIDFDENEARAVKNMWLRKLYRCCPALSNLKNFNVPGIAAIVAGAGGSSAGLGASAGAASLKTGTNPTGSRSESAAGAPTALSGIFSTASGDSDGPAGDVSPSPTAVSPIRAQPRIPIAKRMSILK